MQADLWTFAVTLYQRPGVSDDCLALQDQGANVCLLLCGVWLEQRQVACTPERLATLQALAQAWSSTVVEPLRTLRQQWREQAQHDAPLAQLREAVKGLELQAERVLLERLEQACTPWMAQTAGASWLEAVMPGRHGLAEQASRGALHRLRAAVPDA